MISNRTVDVGAMDAAGWARARRDLERSVKDEVATRFADFIRNQVNPGAEARDAHSETIPRSLWEQAGRLGLCSYGLPRSIGGEGHDFLRFGLMLEEVGYLCDDSAFGVLLGLRAGITHNLWELGRADVIEKYVIPLARGQMGIGFAYTEDADAFSFRSTARRRPDGRWVLDGLKRPVFGGQTADVVLVYVRGEDDDMLAFLIERDDPGVELESIEVNGLRSNGPCLLRLNEAVVAPERLVVATDGFSHAQYSLNWRRLLLACGPLGRMRAFFDDVIAAVSGTVRHALPATEFPPVQAQLGRMALNLMTARAITWEALAGSAAGSDAYWDAVSSAAKYVIAEQANAMFALALRPLATHAYLDGRFARYQRDFATLVTVSGTNDSIERNLGALAVRDLRRRGGRR